MPIAAEEARRGASGGNAMAVVRGRWRGRSRGGKGGGGEGGERGAGTQTPTPDRAIPGKTISYVNSHAP